MSNKRLDELKELVDEVDEVFEKASKMSGGDKILRTCMKGFEKLSKGANLIQAGSESDKKAWNEIKGDVGELSKASKKGDVGIRDLVEPLERICGNLPHSNQVIRKLDGAKLGKIGENLSVISEKLAEEAEKKAEKNESKIDSSIGKELVGPLSEAAKEMAKKDDDFDSYRFLDCIAEFCSNLRSFCDEKGEMFKIMGVRERICACQVNGKMTNTDRYVDEIASGKGEFADVAVGFHEICVQFGANAGGSAFEEVVGLMKRIDKFMS